MLLSVVPTGCSLEAAFECTVGSGGRAFSFMPKGSNSLPVCRESGLNARRFDIEPDTSANRSGPAGRFDLSETVPSSIFVMVEVSLCCDDFLRAANEILLARLRKVRGEDEYSLFVISFITVAFGVVGVTGDLNTGISVNSVKGPGA